MTDPIYRNNKGNLYIISTQIREDGVQETYAFPLKKGEIVDVYPVAGGPGYSLVDVTNDLDDLEDFDYEEYEDDLDDRDREHFWREFYPDEYDDEDGDDESWSY